MRVNDRIAIQDRRSGHGGTQDLASTGSLPRLLSKPRSQLIVIKSVSDPLIVRDPATQAFFEENKTRILIVRTSVCDEDEAKMRRGEFLLQGRSQLAIADFYMHYMDDVVGTSPTIVIEDVSRHRRLGVRGAFPENIRFVSAGDFLEGP